ncbi:MAG: YceI family protein [bacterium]
MLLNRRHRSLICVVSVVCFLIVGIISPSFAKKKRTIFVLKPNSQVTIKGSSTINHWSCQSSQVEGAIQVGAPTKRIKQFINRVEKKIDSGSVPVLTPDLQLPVSSPPRVLIKIPVDSFDCGRKAMNEDMYEALKIQKQPKIIYQLYSLNGAQVKLKPPNKPPFFRLNTNGGLALAGIGKTLDIPLQLRHEGNLHFKVNASVARKMSDFNITPPTALFGLIKAHNDITIEFDLAVKPAQNNKQFVEKKVIESDKKVQN